MGPSLGNIVACCSDDKVIRAFKYDISTGKAELHSQFDFSFLNEFFTLTYMALERNGRLLAVASQIGHLFVYDLEGHRLVFHEKIHLGGIEGLAMHGNLVFTCSSDNCIIMTRIDAILDKKGDPKQEVLLPEFSKAALEEKKKVDGLTEKEGEQIVEVKRSEDGVKKENAMESEEGSA
mgnify:CR=1 FL=1|jgi:WD40 repeat protein